MKMGKLFIIGGTGRLGLEVAKGLVTAAGFDGGKVALVRPSSASGESATQLSKMGWSIATVEDFTSTESMKAALVDAEVIVSTMSGPDAPKIEKATIDAAKAVNARLFVPSQFGVDYRRWNITFPVFKGKKSVVDYADEVGMPTLKVFTGWFSDAIFNIVTNLKDMEAKTIGDGTQRISFTKRGDIGFVLAKALADPEFANGGFMSMYSDTLSWNDALALVEKVKGGKFKQTFLTPDEAKKQEEDFLGKGQIGPAMAMHLMGEPTRGSAGLDLSVDDQPSNKYGLSMEPLLKTLQETLPGNDGGYVRR